MSVAIQSVLIWMYLCGRRGNRDTHSGGRGLHYVTEDYYEKQNGNLVALVSYLRKIMCPGYGPHFVLLQQGNATHEDEKHMRRERWKDDPR